MILQVVKIKEPKQPISRLFSAGTAQTLNKAPTITDQKYFGKLLSYSYFLRVKSPTPLAKIGKTSVHKSAEKYRLKQMGFYYILLQAGSHTTSKTHKSGSLSIFSISVLHMKWKMVTWFIQKQCHHAMTKHVNLRGPRFLCDYDKRS